MPFLNYHHLRYFRVIAREQSLARAAEKLNLSAPALSIQLKQLEESLGHLLVERGPFEAHDLVELVVDLAEHAAQVEPFEQVLAALSVPTVASIFANQMGEGKGHLKLSQKVWLCGTSTHQGQ